MPFVPRTTATQYCAIGSLKSNIGHAGEAAGICSFIKTVMALQHRELPPSLHYESPNPQIDFANSPFFVNSSLRQWTTPHGQATHRGRHRRWAPAARTCTCCCRRRPPPRPSAPSRAPTSCWCCRHALPAALDCRNARPGRASACQPDPMLGDVAHTLLVGRKRFAHRRAVVVRDVADAIAALEATDRKQFIAAHREDQQAPPCTSCSPVAGRSTPAWARGLYENEPVYRDAFEAALCIHRARAAHGAAVAGAGIRRTRRRTANHRLKSPSRAVPLMFVAEYALAQAARLLGHRADCDGGPQRRRICGGLPRRRAVAA